MTKKPWQVVELGEVVRHRSAFVEIDDRRHYMRCRVQTGARGVVLRDTVPGSAIKTKRQQVCQSDDFLVAEIDAKSGGYGLVGDDLNGAIVSSHYFLYEADKNKLLPQFLGWYSKTPLFHSQVTAQGSTNYASIRPRHVLNYRIPLPPVDEQRKIVARLERVERLAHARQAVVDSMEAEAGAMLRSAFNNVVDGAPMRALAEVAPLVRRPVQVCLDASYPEIGVRSFGRGIFHKPSLPGAEVGSKKLFFIKPGDIV
ncbi:MAG: restriction endonuclease subunit S, partial [Verrucomicrobiota bacterium JB024]|nr:restriction endonuclease subunit S [Verrucomicrobiota bacterium JB024]